MSKPTCTVCEREADEGPTNDPAQWTCSIHGDDYLERRSPGTPMTIEEVTTELRRRQRRAEEATRAAHSHLDAWKSNLAGVRNRATKRDLQKEVTRTQAEAVAYREAAVLAERCLLERQ